jgi:hypothetical protein
VCPGLKQTPACRSIVSAKSECEIQIYSVLTSEREETNLLSKACVVPHHDRTSVINRGSVHAWITNRVHDRMDFSGGACERRQARRSSECRKNQTVQACPGAAAAKDGKQKANARAAKLKEGRDDER